MVIDRVDRRPWSPKDRGPSLRGYLNSEPTTHGSAAFRHDSQRVAHDVEDKHMHWW